MKTKPRDIHATFDTDYYRCGDEITVTNGRPDRHQCDPPQFIVYATHEDVADGQEIRHQVMARLEAAFDNL